jgi:hypothetical protein
MKSSLINKLFKKAISSRKTTLALIAGCGMVSHGYAAIDFSAFGSAPQVAGYSAYLTGTDILSVLEAEAANFTASSTNSTAYGFLSASTTLATTFNLTDVTQSPVYYHAITLGSTVSQTATATGSNTVTATGSNTATASTDTLTATVTATATGTATATATATAIATVTSLAATVGIRLANQISPQAVASFSAPQLAALINAGLANPNLYRAFNGNLTTVAGSVLSQITNTYLCGLIPKAVRTALMTGTVSTALTNNVGWSN